MKSIVKILSLTALWACCLSAAATEVNVGPFEELRVLAPVNVNYVSNPDSAGLAVFHCHPSLVPAFVFENTKGCVKVTLNETVPLIRVTLPTLTLYSQYLTKAENIADSTLTIVKLAEGPKVSLMLEGNGKLIAPNLKMAEVNATQRIGKGSIILSGEAERSSLKQIGSGVIDAKDLKAKEVSVTMGGPGNISLWATKKLSVLGAGTGDATIHYREAPEIKNRSFGVTLRRVE